MTIKIPKKRMMFVCFSLAVILLSLVFYIVVMAIGFGLPGDQGGINSGNIGLWHQTAAGSESINGSGICCIVFAVIITALLVADYFLVKKHKIFVSRYLKRAAITLYVLFILAMVLAFAGKPADPQGQVSPWFDTGGMSYTTAGMIIVIFLSALSIVPLTYGILTIVKFSKNKKRQKAALHRQQSAKAAK